MTNVVTDLNVVGMREDLENMIYKVYAMDTPLTSAAGATPVKAPYHEWQTMGLAAPNPNNAQISGFTAVNDAPRLTQRLGNRTQLFSKTGQVSDQLEFTDQAGRDSELNLQKLQAGQEIIRDIEARLIGNYSSAVETANTPAYAAGLEAFLVSNVDGGNGRVNGGFSGGIVNAATPGTPQAFTEAGLKQVALSIFQNGGKPTVAIMGGALKQIASTFTGVAANRIDNSGKGPVNIVGAAEIYETDFSKLALRPHPYACANSCLVIDPRMLKVGTLREVSATTLAKTGDSTQFLLRAEKTLVVANEKAHGVVADLSAPLG